MPNQSVVADPVKVKAQHSAFSRICNCSTAPREIRETNFDTVSPPSSYRNVRDVHFFVLTSPR